MGLFTETQRIKDEASFGTSQGDKFSVGRRVHKARLGSDKGPKKPEKSAEQLALERRQQEALDKEIAEGERRAKEAARGRLGANTLLSGADPTQERVVTRGGAGAGGGASLLGGLPSASGSRGGTSGRGTSGGGTPSGRGISGRSIS